MLISKALAAHFAPAGESGGGANTFTIILVAAVAIGLAYFLYRRWRRGQPGASENDSDYDSE